MKPSVLALVAIFFVASSSLLVLNKVAVTKFNNASFVLMAQLIATVVLVSIPGFSGYVELRMRRSKEFHLAYFRVAVVFLFTIYSNMKLIHLVGVNPFIVLRCSTPLIISILDWAFLGRQLPDRRSLLSLMGILFFGTKYAQLKLTVNPDIRPYTEVDPLHCFIWSVIWLLSFVLDTIYLKFVVDTHKCSGLERTLFQNLMAIPLILPVLIFSDRRSLGVELLKLESAVPLFLSCIDGAILSFVGMSLRAELSATSFTVLGVTCKMASCVLNEVFVIAESNRLCILYIFAVVLSSSLYKQSPVRG